jgi:CRP-like cAMP-binding protein
VRLLDHLPELAADVGPSEAAVARRALTVPAVAVAKGRCELSSCQADRRVTGRLFALLIVEGLLVREVTLNGRPSSTLCGPSDLLDLQSDPHASLGADVVVTSPDTARIALLDDRTLAAMRRWPRMIARLFTLAMRQLDRAETSTAISQLERVEDRLLSLFWQMADRWGRRHPEGIVIDQPLTHEALGHLVGARRPTISLGLRALGEQHLLRRTADGTWLLAPESLHLLANAGSP